MGGGRKTSSGRHRGPMDAGPVRRRAGSMLGPIDARPNETQSHLKIVVPRAASQMITIVNRFRETGVHDLRSVGNVDQAFVGLPDD